MPKKFLKKWLEYVEKYLRNKKIGGQFYKKELSIVFLSTAEAKRINSKFRKKKYATDVLSFEGQFDLLGDLILCSNIVKKQAASHNLAYRQEAAYLVLHGLLHLLGYEHERGGAQAKKMFAIQDKIFANISKIK